MPENYSFILIDDVASNNLLAKMNIRNTFPGSGVVEFTNAEAGYDHILQHYSQPGNVDEAILLIDIHMPAMDGWGFLLKFDELNENVKSRIKIYMLSASIDHDDQERAMANKNVTGYLLKPITGNVLKELDL